ncbi:MAG: FHA domain-containing protein [Verrucomicrobiota bacterium]
METYGPRSTTGAFRISKADGSSSGSIYLHDGSIVFSETKGYRDSIAIFMMMSWADAKVEFTVDKKTSKIGCKYDTDLILFEFIRLEDQFPDKKALVSHLVLAHLEQENKETEKVKARELPNLKSYLLYLEVEQEGLEADIYQLKQGPLSIGSSDACDLVIKHPSISRIHCRVILSQHSLIIQDLGSTNGTYIEGRMVEKDYAIPGDLIQLGEMTLRVKGTMRRALNLEKMIPDPQEEMPERKMAVRPLSFNPLDQNTRAIHWENLPTKKSVAKKSLLRGLIKK